MVALSADDVIAGFNSPLAPEIDTAGFRTIEKMRITYERCLLYKKYIFNVYEKPESH